MIKRKMVLGIGNLILRVTITAVFLCLCSMSAYAQEDLAKGLVGYWTFDDKGNPGKDSSGHNHHGTLKGPVWEEAEAGNGVLKFDGVDDYVDLGDVAEYEFGPEDRFSVSLWIKPVVNEEKIKKVGRVAVRGYLIGRVNNTREPHATSWAIGDYTSAFSSSRSAEPRFVMGSGIARKGGGAAYSIGRLRFGPWYHLTVVVGAKGEVIETYLNGVKTRSGKRTIGQVTQNSGSFRIGGEYSYYFFSGQIDDLRIYNRTLTQEDVQALNAQQNKPPRTQNQELFMLANTAVPINMDADDPNVIQKDALTYEVVKSPANGVLSGKAPNLTYTPKRDFSGADSFSFKANDGTLDSNIAKVAIDVRFPAFPGAEGAGAVATGGRGGKVIKVTNLNPKGPGSLQAACEQEGPRIVVFDVSGVIRGNLRVQYGQLTIAGQTAPGAGITINGHVFANGPLEMWRDIVIRFLRMRPNPPRGHGGGGDGVQMGFIKNLILDHVSVGWGGDETLSITRSGPFTVQWSTVEESALISEGGTTPHNFGSHFGYTDKPVTVHHSLYAHHSDRAVGGCMGSGLVDIRNNVSYNCSGGCGGANVVGNYFKAGPAGPHGRRGDIAPSGIINIKGSPSAQDLEKKLKCYVDGNFCDLAGGYTYWTSPTSKRKAARADSPNPTAPVKTHTAEQAYDLIMVHAGCLPRDAVTRRTLKEAHTGTGSWGAVMPEGGLMAGLTPGQAPPDSDNDGMPDAWETAHQLNPNDPKDANKVVPAGASKGDRHKNYTYIEYYINERADILIAEAIADARAAEKPPAPPRPIEITPWSAAQPGAREGGPGVAKHLDKLRSVNGKARGVNPWVQARNLCYYNRPVAKEDVGILIGLLDSKNDSVRNCASWVIGCMENPPKEAIAPLIKAMQSNIPGNGCWQAWALARIGPAAADHAVPALVKVKGRGRANAAYALTRMGPKAGEAIPYMVNSLTERGGYQLHYMYAKALAGLGEDAVPALSELLGGPRKGRIAGKDYAALAMAWMGPKAKAGVPALIKTLAGKDPLLRRRAVLALACIGPETPEVLPALVKALKDESWLVRYETAKGLALIGLKAKPAADALAAALKDSEFMVRAASAEALGWIGLGTGIKVNELATVLDTDKHPWPRFCAARALSRFGPGAGGAVDTLARALNDSDSDVRAEAAWALGRIGSGAKEAIPALKKALNDENETVRHDVKTALQEIGSGKP